MCNHSIPFWKRAWRRLLPHVGRWRVTRSLIKARGNLWHKRNDPYSISRHLSENKSPRLHLGCGPHHLAGWLNADLHAYAAGVIEIDATRTFPLPDNSFAYVFTEHMVEHVPLCESMRCFSECFRVLRPGGVLRVSTPDLAFLASLLRADLSPLHKQYIDWSCKTYVGTPTVTAAIAINNFVRNWGHQFIFDKETLELSLHAAGFKAVAFNNVHQSSHPELRGLENLGRLPEGFVALESIIVEATKS